MRPWCSKSHESLKGRGHLERGAEMQEEDLSRDWVPDGEVLREEKQCRTIQRLSGKREKTGGRRAQELGGG